MKKEVKCRIRLKPGAEIYSGLRREERILNQPAEVVAYHTGQGREYWFVLDGKRWNVIAADVELLADDLPA